MLAPVQGQTVQAGPMQALFEVTSAMVDGHYSLVRQTIAPGSLFWPHVHTNEDQVIIVLKGHLGAKVGEREWTASPGEVIHRPKTVPHTIWNAGPEPVEFLEITSPGRFEQYFLDQADAASSGRPDRREQVLMDYGISAVDGWAEDLGRRYGVG